MKGNLLCKMSDYRLINMSETEPNILLFEAQRLPINFETCIKAVVKLALRMFISHRGDKNEIYISLIFSLCFH